MRRRFGNIPILLLTAVNQQFPLGFSDKDIDSKWLPVTDFLEKPVDFTVLREKLTAPTRSRIRNSPRLTDHASVWAWPTQIASHEYPP